MVNAFNPKPFKNNPDFKILKFFFHEIPYPSSSILNTLYGFFLEIEPDGKTGSLIELWNSGESQKRKNGLSSLKEPPGDFKSDVGR